MPNSLVLSMQTWKIWPGDWVMGFCRVLAMLVTWLEVHVAWINVDRLTALAGHHPSVRMRAFWSAVAIWRSYDRRFARMAKSYCGPRLPRLGMSSRTGKSWWNPNWELVDP